MMEKEFDEFIEKLKEELKYKQPRILKKLVDKIIDPLVEEYKKKNKN